MMMKKITTLILSIAFALTAFGQNVQSIVYENWANGSWQNVMKQSNTYDGNGYLIKELSESWNVSIGSYKNYSQINYTNNSNGTVQQFIIQDWDNGSNSWANSQRRTYTYNGAIAIYELDNIDFKVFPNPATNKLNVSFENNGMTEASIFDMYGRMLLYNVFEGSEISIDITSLPSNIYILSMKRDSQTKTIKFVKN